MKIYTRTGDGGMTSLFSGERVSKSDPRVVAYGCVDELNSLLGLARASGAVPEVDSMLRRLQVVLFTLGADLATATGGRAVARISAADIEALENEIDAMNAALPAVKCFVLPGGSSAAATLHVARCVCRRAEREALLVPAGELSVHALTFLNRLSDHIFMLARLQNHLAGTPEEKWDPPPAQS